jgi:hypothetical protein
MIWKGHASWLLLSIFRGCAVLARACKRANSMPQIHSSAASEWMALVSASTHAELDHDGSFLKGRVALYCGVHAAAQAETPANKTPRPGLILLNGLPCLTLPFRLHRESLGELTRDFALPRMFICLNATSPLLKASAGHYFHCFSCCATLPPGSPTKLSVRKSSCCEEEAPTAMWPRPE